MTRDASATHADTHPPTAGDSDALWIDGDLDNPHAVHDKAVRVRRMFDAIAPTYERVNRLTSAGRDRSWRGATVAAADLQPDHRVLDVACGTGDLARAFAAAGARRVVGLDFARQMLRHGAAPPNTAWCQGDALQLPFASGVFDVVSCAFGVRNFQNLRCGLAEMHRVLRPGGRAVICEFGMPRGRMVGRLYGWYFTRVLPRLATWISGDRTGAYCYLPSSVISFASPGEMIGVLRAVGFADVQSRRQTLGIAHVYRAAKGPS